jgi:hypothetical protein
MEKRIKQLFHNKRNKIDWDFGSLDNFTDWYKTQLAKQNNSCYYCEVNQDDIILLIGRGIIKSKRFNKRGNNLEIDRKDTRLYSKENCVLACYFCNNHKSDIINSDDFKKHFGKAQFEYIQYLITKLI